MFQGPSLNPAAAHGDYHLRNLFSKPAPPFESKDHVSIFTELPQSRSDLGSEDVEPRLTGWLAREDPFAFETGICRLSSGHRHSSSAALLLEGRRAELTIREIQKILETNAYEQPGADKAH